jgi:Peptidase C39 family
MLGERDKPAPAGPAPTPAESRLAALVLLLRFQAVSADPGQIRHHFGDTLDVAEILRCIKEFGLKARTFRTNWERLIRTPLPCIAVLRDGRHLLLGKASEDQVLVQDPMSPQPMFMSRAEFEAVWDGRLILAARRAELADLTRRFGISWFVGAIHAICLAKSSRPRSSSSSSHSSHRCSSRSSSTRSWSVAPQARLTYLFAHTTNRIDTSVSAELAS